MDIISLQDFHLKKGLLKRNQYGKISTLCNFEAVKEFVTSLCDCYQDEVDEPLHMLLAYLNKLNISMKESTK